MDLGGDRMSAAAVMGWIAVAVYVWALVKFRERWIIALLPIALLAAILLTVGVLR